MRLRPSGNAGPIATSLAGFIAYQESQAWTWEHMALTRARVIAGPEALSQKIDDAVAKILTSDRDSDKLATDVLEMRRRIARAHWPSNEWDVKYIDGGLVDVEFIAQYLQLAHGHEDGVFDTNTGAALARLAEAGVVAGDSARMLAQAGKLWRTIQGMLRFASDGAFDEDGASEGLKAALVEAAEMEDSPALKRQMVNTAREVRAAFIGLIGDPGASNQLRENRDAQ